MTQPPTARRDRASVRLVGVTSVGHARGSPGGSPGEQHYGHRRGRRRARHRGWRPRAGVDRGAPGMRPRGGGMPHAGRPGIGGHAPRGRAGRGQRTRPRHLRGRRPSPRVRRRRRQPGPADAVRGRRRRQVGHAAAPSARPPSSRSGAIDDGRARDARGGGQRRCARWHAARSSTPTPRSTTVAGSAPSPTSRPASRSPVTSTSATVRSSASAPPSRRVARSAPGPPSAPARPSSATSAAGRDGGRRARSSPADGPPVSDGAADPHHVHRQPLPLAAGRGAAPPGAGRRGHPRPRCRPPASLRHSARAPTAGSGVSPASSVSMSTITAAGRHRSPTSATRTSS